MKKLLLLLALAFAAITLSAPHSFAYSKNPWKDMEKMVPDLEQGFQNLKVNERRYGSSPYIRSQMADIRYRLNRWTAVVGQRAGDPSVARKAGENIGISERQLAADIRSGGRPGGAVHVYHHFW